MPPALNEGDEVFVTREKDGPKFKGIITEKITVPGQNAYNYRVDLTEGHVMDSEIFTSDQLTLIRRPMGLISGTGGIRTDRQFNAVLQEGQQEGQQALRRTPYDCHPSLQPCRRRLYGGSKRRRRRRKTKRRKTKKSKKKRRTKRKRR